MSSDSDQISSSSTDPTPTSRLPEEVNDFSHQRTTPDGALYEDLDGNTVLIYHADTSESDVMAAGEYRLSYATPAGDEVRSRAIQHGPDTDRTIKNAVGAVETQLWEWARFDPDEYHPFDQSVANLGIPDPHSPGERPTVAEEWHYSYKIADAQLPDEGTRENRWSTMAKQSRFTFRASNEDSNWYYARLEVSYFHEPPAIDEDATGEAFGATMYIMFTPLKPVDDRTGEYDTRKMDREYIVNDDPDVSRSESEIVSLISEAKSRLTGDTMAIGDEDYHRIREEAERRLNEETGEYEDQARLSSY